MRKLTISILSISFGLLTAIIIFINHRVIHSLNVDFVAYFIPPIALCLILMKGNFWNKKTFLTILASLIVYGIVVGLSELVVFESWHVLTTPAGGTYTRYGLDAMYPEIGVIILLISFLFALTVRMIVEAIMMIVQRMRVTKKQV